MPRRVCAFDATKIGIYRGFVAKQSIMCRRIGRRHAVRLAYRLIDLTYSFRTMGPLPLSLVELGTRVANGRV